MEPYQHGKYETKMGVGCAPSILRLIASRAAGDLYVRVGFLRDRVLDVYVLEDIHPLSLLVWCRCKGRIVCSAEEKVIGCREPKIVVDNGSMGLRQQYYPGQCCYCGVQGGEVAQGYRRIMDTARDG